MSSSKISTFEAISLILTVLVAHSVVSLPRNIITTTKSATIINILYVGIIALLIVYLIYKLLKGFPTNDIIDISEYLGGKVFKTIIGSIFILYILLSSSILLRNFCECLKIVYYPMTNLIFIMIFFIIAVSISTRTELASIAKVNLIFLPLVLFSVFFIFVANLDNFSITNMFPILGDGISNTFITGLGNLGAFGGIAILYLIPPYLKQPENLKKISLIAITISIIYLLLCVSTILFMFSILINVDEIMPLYSAARYIEFGTFFQRLESIFLLIWILEMACYISISIFFAMGIFKKIANLKTAKPLVTSFSFAILALGLLPPNLAISRFIENTVYQYLVIGMILILSILILITANLKKRYKNKQKVVAQNV